MKKEISLLFVCLALVLFVPVVLAIDTQINVRTLPDHKVSIFVQNPTPPISTLESFYANSGSQGMVSVSYSGSYKDSATLNIKVTKDGKEVMHEIFEDTDLGQPIYIQLKPGEISKDYRELDKDLEEENVTESLNLTEANETVSSAPEIESIEEKSENISSSGDLTGFSVFDTAKKVPSIVYYIILIILFVGAAVIVTMKVMHCR